jgi:hypothetical protein
VFSQLDPQLIYIGWTIPVLPLGVESSGKFLVRGGPTERLVDDQAKIGDRLQIAEQSNNLLAPFDRANLVPVTDFRPGLAVSRQKLTSEPEIMPIPPSWIVGQQDKRIFAWRWPDSHYVFKSSKNSDAGSTPVTSR